MALQRKEHRRPQPQMVPQVAGQGTQDGKGMEHQGTCREPLGLHIADMDGEGLEEAVKDDQEPLPRHNERRTVKSG